MAKKKQTPNIPSQQDELSSSSRLGELIEEQRASAKSLMPEGMEKEVSPQQAADLFAFLRSSGPPPHHGEASSASPIGGRATVRRTSPAN